LERLLLVAPEDPDLKKALVNVHIKAGDQKRVVELYESIADDLVATGTVRPYLHGTRDPWC